MIKLLKVVYRFCRNLVDTPAVILLYHRVTDLSQDPQQLAVSPANFAAHLDILRREYFLIGIDEFVEIVTKGKRMPRKTVVITFDDGYADNLHEAIPILESKKAQAIFYITTSNIGMQQELWWDDLERIFLTGSALPPALQVNIRGMEYSFETATPESRISTYHSLHPLIKECVTPERDNVMNSIVAWSGHSKAGRDTHRMMTSAELVQLSVSTAAVIGAHTDTHPKLSVCCRLEQYNEILRSKEKLEALTHRPIKHFSYPFGAKKDYNRDSIAVCQELGFSVVCSNYYDQVHRWHSRLELPRVLVRNWGAQEFEVRIKNFFRT